MAFGEPQRFWPFVSRLVEFATIVPALLLFEDFYGKGWRSSVRWLMWAYVVFATIAFANIVIQRRPDLIPTAGIGPPLGRGAIRGWGAVFNVLNHLHFDEPVADIANTAQFGSVINPVSSPTSIFGSFLGADASPRLIQLHASITF